MSAKPNILYRFYDAEDTLLYVGITNSPRNRFNSHRTDKAWFKHVVRSTMQHFDTRTELEAAEIVAIKAEKPKHNVAHSVAPLPNRIGVGPRVSHHYTTDASRFTAPDSIATEDPTDNEREARLDELEQIIARRPTRIPYKPCPTCDLKVLTREYDGLIKCLNCLGMWTPEEIARPSDFEFLKQLMAEKRSKESA